MDNGFLTRLAYSIFHSTFCYTSAPSTVGICVLNTPAIYRRITAHCSGQIRGGCWDGYGQVGVDYAWRTGPQPATIRSMIRSLAGR